jgi:hypothetical protein
VGGGRAANSPYTTTLEWLLDKVCVVFGHHVWIRIDSINTDPDPKNH